MQDQAELMNDFRLTLNKDTRMCMSLAARPGNFGTRLHNFLYAKLNLNYFYKSFTTNDLKHAVAGIRALGIRGCAISMPFKEEVMAYLDHFAPSAARINAVNTIVNDGGVLTGLNTDYIAIQRVCADKAIPLEAHIGIFGSGGMAKAIVSALDDCGYRHVTLVARNEQTGQLLADKYSYRWLPQWASLPGWYGPASRSVPLPRGVDSAGAVCGGLRRQSDSNPAHPDRHAIGEKYSEWLRDHRDPIHRTVQALYWSHTGRSHRAGRKGFCVGF
jgi:hypothetical protein